MDIHLRKFQNNKYTYYRLHIFVLFYFIQITVEANDNGKPNPQKSTGFVIVDVTRVIIPKFENLPFVITQPESTTKGDLVYTVKTTKAASVSIASILAKCSVQKFKCFH